MHKHKITLYSESFLEPSLKYCPKFKDHFFESPTPNFDYSLLHIKSLSDEQNPLKIIHFSDFLLSNSLSENLGSDCIGKNGRKEKKCSVLVVPCH